MSFSAPRRAVYHTSIAPVGVVRTRSLAEFTIIGAQFDTNYAGTSGTKQIIHLVGVKKVTVPYFEVNWDIRQRGQD